MIIPDYPTDMELIVPSNRYLYYFIVQNTSTVEAHKEKILKFLEEKEAEGMYFYNEYRSEVVFTYILFDKEPYAFTCHHIEEFKEKFDCATDSALSAGMETLSAFLKENQPKPDDDSWTIREVYFIGDGKDFQTDNKETLEMAKDFFFQLYCNITLYRPDLQEVGRLHIIDEEIESFFQIKKPEIDWKELMKSNEEIIKKQTTDILLRKTPEELLEEIRIFLSQHNAENDAYKFEVRGEDVFVSGYEPLENRKGYPIGEGIVSFRNNNNTGHELYLANTFTGKIRQLSTAGGKMLAEDHEIDFEAIEKKCKHGINNARRKDIRYSTIGRWGNFCCGINAISWMLFPEGRYFADSDGFGGEDNNEENVYAIINTDLEYVEPFRPIDNIYTYLMRLRENGTYSKG